MPTVVVVGSDHEVRSVMTGKLTELGIAVIAADDAFEAIARVNAMAEQPDLILLDRRVARGAEMELLEWMRSRSRLDDVPIVLFTAHGSGSADAPPSESLLDAFDAELLLSIVQAVCAHPANDR